MREIQPDLVPDPRGTPEIVQKAEAHLAALAAAGLIADAQAEGSLLRWLAGAAENTWAGHAVAKLASALLEELEALPSPPAEDDGIADVLADAFRAVQEETP